MTKTGGQRAARAMKSPSELRIKKVNKVNRATQNVARVRKLLMKLKERLAVAESRESSAMNKLVSHDTKYPSKTQNDEATTGVPIETPTRARRDAPTSTETPAVSPVETTTLTEAVKMLGGAPMSTDSPMETAAAHDSPMETAAAHDPPMETAAAHGVFLD